MSDELKMWDKVGNWAFVLGVAAPLLAAGLWLAGLVGGWIALLGMVLIWWCCFWVVVVILLKVWGQETRAKKEAEDGKRGV